MNSNMTENEERVFHRPPWDPDGVLVARKELKLGRLTIPPGAKLPKRHGLDERQLKSLWDHAQLDTYPRARGSFFHGTDKRG